MQTTSQLPFAVRRSVGVLKACRPISMGQDEDFDLFVGALDYVLGNKIEGAVVECGVWKGSYALASMLVMQDRNQWRDVWLYDTFAGMTDPNPERDTDRSIEHKGTLAVSLDDVKLNMGEFVGKPVYIVGDVRETLPASVPESIAILRLDVDWYDTTKHCLEHLYPRLSMGGVLIMDDYFYWKGAQDAFDEYLPDAEIIRYGTGSVVIKK